MKNPQASFCGYLSRPRYTRRAGEQAKVLGGVCALLTFSVRGMNNHVHCERCEQLCVYCLAVTLRGVSSHVYTLTVTLRGVSSRVCTLTVTMRGVNNRVCTVDGDCESSKQ